MALIKCKECGKNISRKAAVCPECGHPLKKPLVTGPAGCFLQLISLFPIFFGLATLIDGNFLGGGLIFALGMVFLYVGGRTKAGI